MFSGSYAYDKNGDISDDITFTRVFTTDSSNKVLSFGNNVYGFALYTPEPSLSLSGIAVTKSDDSSFQKHADDLKEKYGLDVVECDSDSKMVRCNSNGYLVDWYMSDCEGYNGKERIWKTRGMVDKNSYPITQISLCSEVGSEAEGWERLKTAAKGDVVIGDGNIALSVRKDKTGRLSW
ncbi:MAG TPA: hypothetical protein DCO86_00980 [Spirochaetaceae bacterium]|nr:hypothetical protein [Spirochaetaceae bacterium]